MDVFFFKHKAVLTEKYDLPPPEVILLLNKENWKLLIKRTVRDCLTEQLREVAEERSTLERGHGIYPPCLRHRMDVMRAIVKVRILTGIYPL